MTASSVSAPCMSSANAFSTARRPLVLEIATGFAAQRLAGPSGRGGRIGCGISPARPAAIPTAAGVRDSRRETRADTGRLRGVCGFSEALGGGVVEPLGRFFQVQLAGGDMPAGTRITIDQEITLLERLLDADPPPSAHRAALAGIRLAEIYRTHQQDPAQADALLARLAARYPDAPELAHTRRGNSGIVSGALTTIEQETPAPERLGDAPPSA